MAQATAPLLDSTRSAPDLFLVRKLLKNWCMRCDAAAPSAFVRPGEKALRHGKKKLFMVTKLVIK
jgi:hypothetical protein